MRDQYEKVDTKADELIGHLDEAQLKGMYQLFLTVPSESGMSENMIYSGRMTEIETGQHGWYGIRFDNEGELEYMTLDTQGDVNYKTQDETVENVLEDLKGVLVKMNLKGKWYE